MRLFLSILAVSLFLTGAAMAHSFKVGNIAIGHPWMLPMEDGQTSAQIYLSLLNNGEEEDALIAAKTELAEKVEIVNVITENGQSKSNILDRLTLAHDRPTPMRPGGSHLLLSGIKKPVLENQRFPMTLTFAKAGDVTVEIMAHAPKAGAAGH